MIEVQALRQAAALTSSLWAAGMRNRLFVDCASRLRRHRFHRPAADPGDLDRLTHLTDRAALQPGTCCCIPAMMAQPMAFTTSASTSAGTAWSRRRSPVTSSRSAPASGAETAAASSSAPSGPAHERSHPSRSRTGTGAEGIWAVAAPARPVWRRPLPRPAT